MRRQQGQAIVLIAIMLTVLIGMAAIAIDGSRAYAMRRDLQVSVDAAALAASDQLQQSGNFINAEQAATTVFASNMHLYGVPSCQQPYAQPPFALYSVTCNFADGTVLVDTVQRVGPQGIQFKLTASRTLQLQFGRILTNGTSPTLSTSATGNVNNLRYTPALAALNQAGCGGVGGSAISVGGSGTLYVTGDVVANGAIAVAAGGVQVAGDIYARCQSPVPGPVANLCYPSGAVSPCSYPDVAGATRSGFRLADPRFPAPTVTGGNQGVPTSAVISPGIYAWLPNLNSGRCWFLSAGVYEFAAGTLNSGDFMSNELKPPDEPNVLNNTSRAASQFWNTNGVNCAGSFQLQKVTAAHDVPTGWWSFVVTSVRSDTYNGVSYQRESAPSMCQQVHLTNHFDAVQLTVSNVPGATSYNIYAAPPGSGCSGPFGLAANLAVSAPVLNSGTGSCPSFSGSGCSLGFETILVDDQIVPPFAPNAAAPPGTSGAYPPDPETAPLGAGLPNQNPGRGAGATGDRANENNCETLGGAYASCPGPITPGAVELYYPAGACLSNGNGSDTYVFSGYQYNWVSVYEPATNFCSNTLGAQGNSGYIGLVYMPSARASITSPHTFEVPAIGGLIASTIAFSGSLPSIAYSSAYAPVPPASRLIS
jgi:Flp pilus assembly protein TadG